MNHNADAQIVDAMAEAVRDLGFRNVTVSNGKVTYMAAMKLRGALEITDDAILMLDISGSVIRRWDINDPHSVDLALGAVKRWRESMRVLSRILKRQARTVELPDASVQD